MDSSTPIHTLPNLRGSNLDRDEIAMKLIHSCVACFVKAGNMKAVLTDKPWLCEVPTHKAKPETTQAELTGWDYLMDARGGRE